MQKEIAVIITCDRNRSPLPALSALADAQAGQFAEIVVVLFDLDELALGENANIISRVLIIKNRSFNKCLGINLGVLRSSSPAIFLMDADVRVTKRTLEAGIKSIRDSKSYATIRRVRSVTMRPPSREERRVCKLVFPDATSLSVTTARKYSDGARAGPGLVFVRRTHFLSVGGMNSELNGWGWEDIDLLVRLRMKLGLRRRYVGDALHESSGCQHSVADIRRRAISEQRNMYTAALRYQQMQFDGTFVSDAAALESGQIQGFFAQTPEKVYSRDDTRGTSSGVTATRQY